MDSPRLFLSRVGSDFDPARDIVTGPWCFAGNEEAFDSCENLEFTEPFPDRQSLLEAGATTCRLANHLALSWTDRMNREHGCAYSPAFWRNILILWMLGVIQGTWQCYRNLDLLVKRHGTQPLKVGILDEEPVWPINDLSDFMDLLTTNGDFHFWMSSLLVRKMAPPGWTLEPVSRGTKSSANMLEATGGNVAQKERNSLLAFIGRSGFDYVPGTKYSRLLFSLLINLLPRRPAAGKSFNPDKAILNEFPETYLESLWHILESTRLHSLGRNFLTLEKKAKTFRYSPGRLTITHAASVDTNLQLINALAVEAGERIVGFQHGGFYGTALIAPWSSETEYIHHAFITWGWTGQGDMYGRMIPLPSPMLSKIRNKHRFLDGDLVFVGAKTFFQNGRIDSSPTPKGYFAYRKMKRDFIAGLAREPMEALNYRPYFRAAQILEEDAYLQKDFPGLRIFKGSLNEKMLGCRLLVLDYPGTTLHQAMAANIPTVCYWGRDDWPLCPQAELQFDLLRKCGMLFDNPADAARHINDIWNDVPEWWNRVEVQNARHTWAESHARTSPVWWWHWARAIWILSRDRESSAPTLKQTAKRSLL